MGSRRETSFEYHRPPNPDKNKHLNEKIINVIMLLTAAAAAAAAAAYFY